MENIETIKLPDTEDELNFLELGILCEDGSIILSGYQLKNIHEFLKAFYQANTDEEP